MPVKLMKWPKKVNAKHEVHGKISLEVEVPQIEANSYDEFCKDFATYVGGEDKAQAIVNNWLGNGAVGSVRSAGPALSKDISLDEAIKKLLDTARDYVPQTGRTGTGVTAKANKFDMMRELTLKAKNGEISTEEYESQLLQIMGLAD